MKTVVMFVAGLLAGVALGGAVVFALFANPIRIEVTTPTEFTIRGGANLNTPGLPVFPGR